MAANRVSHHVLAVMIAVLVSCQEEQIAGPSSFESTELVRFEESDLQNGIDWNRELALVQSEEVLKNAATGAGVDAGILKPAIRIEADVIDRVIKISCEHHDEETAKKYATAYAKAYTDHRRQLALVSENEKLLGLETGFRQGVWGVGQANEQDFRPGTDPRQNALESDLMTYEKAKAALEEAAEDGVLYRKERKEDE